MNISSTLHYSTGASEAFEFLRLNVCFFTSAYVVKTECSSWTSLITLKISDCGFLLLWIIIIVKYYCKETGFARDLLSLWIYCVLLHNKENIPLPKILKVILHSNILNE